MKGFEKDFVRSAFINLAFAQLYASNCKKVVKVDDKWVESCLPKWVKIISEGHLLRVKINRNLSKFREKSRSWLMETLSLRLCWNIHEKTKKNWIFQRDMNNWTSAFFPSCWTWTRSPSPDKRAGGVLNQNWLKLKMFHQKIFKPIWLSLENAFYTSISPATKFQSHKWNKVLLAPALLCSVTQKTLNSHILTTQWNSHFQIFPRKNFL